MIRRPPRSTLDRSSAASDVYKRQLPGHLCCGEAGGRRSWLEGASIVAVAGNRAHRVAVSYTHLRAHETVLDLVCRLLLEKKTRTKAKTQVYLQSRRQKIKSLH